MVEGDHVVKGGFSEAGGQYEPGGFLLAELSRGLAWGGVGLLELLSVLAHSLWGDAGLIAPAGLLGPAGCPCVSLFVPVILPRPCRPRPAL